MRFVLRSEVDDLRAKLAAADAEVKKLTTQLSESRESIQTTTRVVSGLSADLAAAGERERQYQAALLEIFDLETFSFAGSRLVLDAVSVHEIIHGSGALAQSAERTEGERTDTERLDWLQNEVDREMRGVNPKGHVSLFRRNVPITRESIDDDMEVPRG